MERPMHFDARAASVSPSRMTLAVSLAVLLEAGAIYLVGSGLATRVIRALPPQPLSIRIVEPPTDIAPPPPQVPLVKPSLPTVMAPAIAVLPPASPNQIEAVPSQHAGASLPTVVATTQPQVKIPSEPMPPRGVAATHTQPPYPMLARRLGREGTVVLDITVGTDGSVQNVSVSKSSGDDGLDGEALNWVKAHWRYRPATRDGQPVVAQSEAQVVFNLKQSGR
jgi:periplasmic protein TonB